MQTITEIAVEKIEKRAQRIAARLNEGAMNWQRYTVQDGIVPGTFSVVLVDGDTVRPDRSITVTGATRGHSRRDSGIRSVMRSDTAKTPGHRLYG